MRRILVILAIALSEVAHAYGQECEGLLVPDIETMTKDDALRLSYLHQITKKEWNEQKKGFSSSASFLINGGPVSGDLDYDEMKKRLAEERVQTEFNLETHSARWYYASRINPDNAETFLSCVNKTGLKINRFRKQPREDDIVTVEVVWVSPDPIWPRPVKLDFNRSVNIANTKDFPSTVAPGGSVTFPIKRIKPKEAMFLIINTPIGTHSASYVDLPKPKLKPLVKKPPKPSMAELIIATADKNRNPCTVLLKERQGTLPAGVPMLFRYYPNGNIFELDGPHPRHGKRPLGYSNASLSYKQLSLWQAVYTFDETGNLSLDGRVRGKIDCPAI